MIRPIILLKTGSFSFENHELSIQEVAAIRTNQFYRMLSFYEGYLLPE